MKKYFLLILLLLIVGCSNEKKYQKINVGDNIERIYSEYADTTWIDNGCLSIYRIDDGYLIVTADYDKVASISVLSKNKKWTYLDGLTPISFSYELNYKNFTFKQIESMYGEEWIDMGNGVVLPAYITEDGKIIYFFVNNDIINGIYEIDIITKIKQEI